MMKYSRFGAMVATSTVVMFGLMYLNTYALDHIFFSQTRAWMALVMGATMAAVMLAFMLKMYTDKRINTTIALGSVAVFAVALWLVRSQETVDDVVHASHDPSPFDRHPDQRARSHQGPPRTQARRRDHRGSAPRDRRDEGAHRRSRQELALVLPRSFPHRRFAGNYPQ